MIPEEIKMELKTFFNNNWKVIAVAFLIIIGLLSLLWLPNDNPVEQLAEQEIEALTGIKIDLTPEGPTVPPPPEPPKGANGPAGPM